MFAIQFLLVLNTTLISNIPDKRPSVLGNTFDTLGGRGGVDMSMKGLLRKGVVFLVCFTAWCSGNDGARHSRDYFLGVCEETIAGIPARIL